MDPLDILKIFKREKKISTVELDKSDIIYQVWELGRVIAEILEVCWIIKLSLKKGLKKGFLIENGINSFRALETLYKNLSVECKTLSVIEDLSEQIKNSRDKICSKEFNPVEIYQKVEYWQQIIQSELRGKSTHLLNIFLLGLNLRRLKTKLLYEFESEEIEQFIKDNIECIERIEKGDKVLISPNLEISMENLKIIKFRLKSFKRHLSEIRACSKKREEEVISRLIEKRTFLWDDLILDIKNPPDYLNLFQRGLNVLLPFVICYYVLKVIIILLSPYSRIQDMVASIKRAISTNEWILPFILVGIYLLVWLYWKVKDALVIYSFRFKISQFTSFPEPIYYILQLWNFMNKWRNLTDYLYQFWNKIKELYNFIHEIKDIFEEKETRGDEELKKILETLGIQSIKERKKIPLFRSLSIEDFKKVVSKLKLGDYEEGRKIIEEDKKGDLFHIIKSGEVQIIKESEKKVIATLKQPWDFFGEMALLTGEDRMATVKALTEVKTLYLDYEGFNELLKENPATAAELTRMLILRSGELREKTV